LEEHRELGAELRGTVARLHELSTLVMGVYGPQNRAAFEFGKLAESMERLCQDLDAQAEHDWPGYSTQGFYTSARNGE
jgi:hypothetical protein